MKRKKLSYSKPYVCLLIMVSLALVVPHLLSAKDLIINGKVVVLHGEVEYDRVIINNNGILYVSHFDGTDGTGMLSIKANSIYVDETSSINADGCGYRGIENLDGEGPGGGTGGANSYDSGGGGAYGGKGGDGSYDYNNGIPDGKGGNPYGDAVSMKIQMGSAGGASGSRDRDYGGPGGNGGGMIVLHANTIKILGTISANGTNGLIFNNDSSGGGSGGGILLIGDKIKINSGFITANGGNGGIDCGRPNCTLDDGGGGGSGGRVKIFYRISCVLNLKTISYLGGKGALYGLNGIKGTFYKKKTPVYAMVDFIPNDFHPRNPEDTFIAYIELAKGYDVGEIVPTSIILNNCVYAESFPLEIGDYDSDNIPDLKVKFPSGSVLSKIFHTYQAANEIRIIIKGKFSSGVAFKGSDRVKIKF